LNSEAALLETTFRKWGNSAALRLPVALLREADLALEQKVSVKRARLDNFSVVA
jgi:antitoxin component of MazEF toxin-antitoxin module